MTRSPSVLIVSSDAPQLAEAVHKSAPSIDVTPAVEPRDALAAYTGQRILLGSPLRIASVLCDMPAVEWVQSTWAGVTHLAQLDRRDYVLTAAKGIFGPQMSEYVIGYLLSHELKIVKRLDEQRSRRWWPGQSGSLDGKRLGIMGTGSIGRAIAAKARLMGISVTGLSLSGNERPEFDSVYPLSHLADFLQELDYLVSVLPETPETDRLLNAGMLALLRSNALFINVGRGNVVDDAALIAALRNEELAGAVLDVFDEEPVPPDSPLWDTPNLLMTAHTSAMSHPELVVPVFLENYRRFIAGRDMLYAVDFEKGY